MGGALPEEENWVRQWMQKTVEFEERKPHTGHAPFEQIFTEGVRLTK